MKVIKKIKNKKIVAVLVSVFVLFLCMIPENENQICIEKIYNNQQVATAVDQQMYTYEIFITFRYVSPINVQDYYYPYPVDYKIGISPNFIYFTGSILLLIPCFDVGDNKIMTVTKVLGESPFYSPSVTLLNLTGLAGVDLTLIDMQITITPEPAETVTVSFETNGGTAVLGKIIDVGSKITEPVTNRPDYIFDGWYTDVDLTTLWNFDMPIMSNMTLYAKWKDSSLPIDSFNISFETNGGTPVNSILVSFGNVLNEPTDPTRDGYTFDGWYFDEELTILFDFNTPILFDFTLYAKWELVDDRITITFYVDGEVYEIVKVNPNTILI